MDDTPTPVHVVNETGLRIVDREITIERIVDRRPIAEWPDSVEAQRAWAYQMANEHGLRLPREKGGDVIAESIEDAERLLTWVNS